MIGGSVARAIAFLLPLLFSTSLSAQEFGIAADYPNDEGIAGDSAVIFSTGFENGITGWSGNRGTPEIETGASNVNSGNQSVKLQAIEDVDTGEDLYLNFPGEEEVYVRYYVKFHPNTIPPHHMGGISAKVPGFWGSAGSRPPGDKAFWSSLEIHAQLGTGGGWENMNWYFYAYWQEMHSWQTVIGDPDGRSNPYYGNAFNPPGQPAVPRGEWICTEAMLKANTPNQRDGEQAFWINGKLLQHYRTGKPVGEWVRDTYYTWGVYFDPNNASPFEGYNWRSIPELKINSAQIEWYLSHEGVDRHPESVNQNIIWVDDVVIARKFIGCQWDGTGDPPSSQLPNNGGNGTTPEEGSLETLYNEESNTQEHASSSSNGPVITSGCGNTNIPSKQFLLIVVATMLVLILVRPKSLLES